ncbi:MAG TPA: hypothetical protein VIZ28_07755 [Chitinophagaceae bacterium]
MKSFIKNIKLLVEIFSPPVFIAVVLTLYMIAPVNERKQKQVLKEQKSGTAGLAQEDTGPALYGTAIPVIRGISGT